MEEYSPLVSICCFTYNHEKYIRDCIEGVLKQKVNFDYEIIIGEDCSTDLTKKIIESYAALNSKIKIVTSKNNVGMINNFIRTIKAASGKYIAFCEGDDYWVDGNKLQKQFNFMEKNTKFVLCGHAVKVLDNRNNMFLENYQKFNYSGEISINEITKEPLFHAASCFFRSSVFENGIPEYILEAPVLDYYLQLIAAEKGKIYYFNEPMATYRRFTEGSWSEKTSKIENQLDFLERHIITLEKFRSQTNEEYKEHLLKVIEQYIEEIKHIKEKHPKFSCPENYLSLQNIDSLEEYDSIYIFGAGGRGETLKKILDINKIKIKGFIDNNKVGLELYEEKIFSLSMIDKRSLILIASDWYKDIIQQLKKGDFSNFYVFWL
ncbi:glycosyltransferase [Lysinibacillus agricola]|uniref:Glycosyltransferase n=1 Tax=Lysinibacillus agricola TaxID=2590012 RepID=A0ABX7ATG6_9BACI|nr:MULTISPECIES: glycosyltransferase [Lysinibacillus]QQP13260.1 glycosyltransferase [Lysinibacillus agricola]